MEDEGDHAYSTNPHGLGTTTSSERKSRIEEDENIHLQPDRGMVDKSVDGPMTLKHGLIKGMGQLKQHRGLCSDGNQDSVLDEMLASYEEAISILDEIFSEYEGDRVMSSELNPHNSSMSVHMFQPDSFQKYQSSIASSKQNRRGSMRRVRSNTREDGYAWRKYGQKVILNSLYPRCYYRCARKYDHGCKATKQVQITSVNPVMYETAYIGNHTCRNSDGYTGTELDDLLGTELDDLFYPIDLPPLHHNRIG